MKGLRRPWNGGAKYPCHLMILAVGVNDIEGNDAMASGAGDSQRKVVSVAREGADFGLLMRLQHVASKDTNYSYHDLVSTQRELAVAFDGAHWSNG